MSNPEPTPEEEAAARAKEGTSVWYRGAD